MVAFHCQAQGTSKSQLLGGMSWFELEVCSTSTTSAKTSSIVLKYGWLPYKNEQIMHVQLVYKMFSIFVNIFWLNVVQIYKLLFDYFSACRYLWFLEKKFRGGENNGKLSSRIHGSGEVSYYGSPWGCNFIFLRPAQTLLVRFCPSHHLSVARW
jgi:hypothetical protein